METHTQIDTPTQAVIRQDRLVLNCSAWFLFCFIFFLHISFCVAVDLFTCAMERCLNEYYGCSLRTYIKLLTYVYFFSSSVWFNQKARIRFQSNKYNNVRACVFVFNSEYFLHTMVHEEASHILWLCTRSIYLSAITVAVVTTSATITTQQKSKRNGNRCN